METRLYTYKKEILSDGRIIRCAGETVHQTKTYHGWRDTDYLHCISGGYCKDTHACFCNNCKAYTAYITYFTKGE